MARAENLAGWLPAFRLKQQRYAINSQDVWNW
jgi:hypothetical protein